MTIGKLIRVPKRLLLFVGSFIYLVLVFSCQGNGGKEVRNTLRKATSIDVYYQLDDVPTQNILSQKPYVISRRADIDKIINDINERLAYYIDTNAQNHLFFNLDDGNKIKGDVLLTKPLIRLKSGNHTCFYKLNKGAHELLLVHINKAKHIFEKRFGEIIKSALGQTQTIDVLFKVDEKDETSWAAYQKYYSIQSPKDIEKIVNGVEARADEKYIKRDVTNRLVFNLSVGKKMAAQLAIDGLWMSIRLDDSVYSVRITEKAYGLLKRHIENAKRQEEGKSSKE
jgi:hypothetical protein